jgi:adenine-specific DNA-methyltransferase
MASTFERLREWLGTPTYEREGVLLYCGDCLPLLNRLRHPCVRLTVTSPPYNIGKEYEKGLAIPEYLDWCEAWIREIHRVTERNGAFWLNLGYLSFPGRANAIPIPYLLWQRIPFFLVQEIVWNYGGGVACKRSFSPRNEKFLWYVKDQDRYLFNLDAVRDPNVKYPNQKKNGRLKCNPKGKNPTDVWAIPKVTSGENRSSKERMPHPAQFPAALIQRIVRACTNIGDVVLDPFVGSGTVADVAMSLGRPVVGFEINPDYVEIAVRRLERTGLRNEQGRRQHVLFPVE